MSAQTVLRGCIGIALFVTLMILAAPSASGSHSLNNDIRRHPYWNHETRCVSQGWEGSYSHGSVGSKYAIDFVNQCSGSTNWTIRAASQGAVTCVPNHPTLGYYLLIDDPDGNTSVYAHKDSCDGLHGAYAVQGAFLASTGCTGSCTGPHLHYAVWNASGVSIPFSMSGVPTWKGVEGQYFSSNNSGSAYECCQDLGWAHPGIGQGFLNAGGYFPVGSSAAIGSSWSPCGPATAPNIPWVYGCYHGDVQTFRGPGYGDNAQHAIMSPLGSNTGYYLPRGTLGAYTDVWYGNDWVYWFRYPTENRTWNSSCQCYRQNFQIGYIDYYPATCKSEVIYASTVLQTRYYCD